MEVDKMGVEGGGAEEEIHWCRVGEEGRNGKSSSLIRGFIRGFINCFYPQVYPPDGSSPVTNTRSFCPSVCDTSPSCLESCLPFKGVSKAFTRL